MRFLISLLVVLVFLAGAVAVAIYTGTISIGQLGTQTAQLVPPIKPTTALANTASAQDAQPTPAAAPAVSPAARQPQPKEISRQPYGDWMHVCIELPNSTGVRCSIFQRLFDQNSQQTIFLWRISQNGTGGLVSSWQTPTNIMVNRGIVLNAGTEKPIAIPYRMCTPRGCEAQADLAPDFIETLTQTE